MSEKTARINARLAARWARRTVERMKRGRKDIDALNVFPVPDGDTGSNMYQTVLSAYRAVEGLSGTVTLGKVVEAMANGALRGARGNSGLILSVALRGVADALEGVEELTAPMFASALEFASARATEAIADPVNGTMITVLHEMAIEARQQADGGATLVEQITAVRERSKQALSETTGQLQVLHDNEVVDAGSTGIVEIFDLLYLTITGRPLGDSIVSTLPKGKVGTDGALTGNLFDPETGLELVFFLSPGKDRSRPIKRLLTKAGGTSIVVSWPKVHVHVETEEAARTILEQCKPYGIELLRIEELSMTDHQANFRSVVAVARGLGMMQTLAIAEAMVVNAELPGWPERLAELVSETDVDAVVPGAIHTLAASRKVVPPELLVEADHPVKQLSALAVYDPDLESAELVEVMSDCVQDVNTGRVDLVGDNYLYTDDDTRGVAPTLAEAIEAAVRLVAGSKGELATVVTGADGQWRELEKARVMLRQALPHLTVELVAGDIPDSAALVGCE